MIRLVPNHADRIRRTAEVTFHFDGTTLPGCEGETLIAALMRAGVLHLRNAPHDGAPRGGFCAMGLCQECMVRVEGQVVEACRVTVTPGLQVARL